MMKTQSRVLHLDDCPRDRALIQRRLEEEGLACDLVVAENKTEFEAAIAQARFDLILSDYALPGYDGLAALKLARARQPEVPFILISGTIGEERAVDCLLSGATDYVLKDRLTRLAPAVRRALSEAAALAQQKQAEQKLDALRTNICLSLPHELRTPLSAILGFSEMIRADAQTLPRDELLKLAVEICESGERLDRLVQNYLVYAELVLWATDPEKVAALRREQTQHPSRVIGETARQVAQRHKRSNDLSLTLQDAPLAIGPARLTKILDELLDNAFKFSGNDSPVCLQTEAGQADFRLLIRDRGRGMTPEQIASIGPYMQFERARYEQQGGGMGLAIVQQMVELHGGTFCVSAAPTAGTEVRLALPLEHAKCP